MRAVVLSTLVLPGAGHWYLGERRKAIGWIVVTIFLMGRFIWITVLAVNQQLSQALAASEAFDPAAFTISYPAEYGWITLALSLLWIGALVDAVRIARRLRAQHLSDAIIPPQE